eukprot:SAG11_NODE_9692_length_889_cov_1.553165_1_plen_49_part_10
MKEYTVTAGALPGRTRCRAPTCTGESARGYFRMKVSTNADKPRIVLFAR